ncbi:MAG: hypothetical protein H7840_09665 [Alphaproteobacteria bacterium]
MDYIARTASLAEMFTTAMAFERNTQVFYEVLMERIEEGPLRRLLWTLALEGARHYHLCRDIAEREHAHDHADDVIHWPAVHEDFLRCMHTPDLGDEPTRYDILGVSVHRETVAFEEYAELADSTPVGPIADLFLDLAGDNAARKSQLQKMLDEPEDRVAVI